MFADFDTYSQLCMGAVSGNWDVGELVGFTCKSRDAVVTCSFWDIQTSGQATSAGGTGKTTAEMRTKSTFADAGWDFENTWDMCEAVDYSRLQWQKARGDLCCPYGVDLNDFSLLAAHWLEGTCSLENNYCAGSDLDESGGVDVQDLIILGREWLLE